MESLHACTGSAVYRPVTITALTNEEIRAYSHNSAGANSPNVDMRYQCP